MNIKSTVDYFGGVMFGIKNSGELDAIVFGHLDENENTAKQYGCTKIYHKYTGEMSESELKIATSAMRDFIDMCNGKSSEN